MKRSIRFSEDTCYIEFFESVYMIIYKYVIYIFATFLFVVLTTICIKANAAFFALAFGLGAIIMIAGPIEMIAHGGIRMPGFYTYCEIDRRLCTVTLSYKKNVIYKKYDLGVFKRIFIKQIIMRSGAKYHVKLVGDSREVVFHFFNVGSWLVDEDINFVRHWLTPLADWLRVPIQDNCSQNN